MKVILADPAITVIGWIPVLDSIGKYTLRVRKTPEEIKAEREALKKYNPNSTKKIKDVKFEEHTVIEHDINDPSVVYFLPGLWPRVKAELDKRGLSYEIEDKRNPDIRPPIAFDQLGGVDFRKGQDVALALIANSDTGIIETSTAWGKCQDPDTQVLMYDGSYKKARDIVVGDVLMGDDSTPRKVLTTTRGHGKMYEFRPISGKSYKFTGNHMLSLVHCASCPKRVQGKTLHKGDIIDISVEDYIALPNDAKRLLKAYRVGVEFTGEQHHVLDPYFVGVYLGDGTAMYAQITNSDKEVLDYCKTYAESMGWIASDWVEPDRIKGIKLKSADSKQRGKGEAPIQLIRKYGGVNSTTGEKRIPREYLISSTETRLQLLAGLLDTDGYLKYGRTFEIATKWPDLAEDILFLARSLGLYVSSKVERKVCTNTGAAGMYTRIRIGGLTSKIPTKVPRKQAIKTPTKQKDYMHTGFELTPIGDGDYCGFTLDGNHRYLLEDFTVTHNSFLVSVLCKAFPTLNIVVCSSATTVVSTLYEYLDKQLPGQVGFLYSKGDKTKGKRVIVTTLKSLAKLPAENVHMVLVDECHDVGAGEAGRNLMRFCFARRFGFSASPVRNDGSGLVMESICGPTILRMTYDEAVDAGMVTPMKYLMLHCTGCPSIVHNPDMPDVFKKRFSYWCNSYRNKVIASVVYDIKKVSDCQILIVVATLEHAIRLHMQLPWFKVAYYGATDLKDIQKKFPKEKYPNLDLSQYKTTAKQLDIMRQAFAKGTLKYIISTYVFRQGCNFPDLQVLIRADGATSEVMGIQIPGRVARLAEGKKFAYLIDVDDAFDPWTESRAKKRKELYDKQKWIPISRKELLDDLSAGDAKSTADDLRDGSTEEAESGEDNFSAQ